MLNLALASGFRARFRGFPPFRSPLVDESSKLLRSDFLFLVDMSIDKGCNKNDQVTNLPGIYFSPKEVSESQQTRFGGKN